MAQARRLSHARFAAVAAAAVAAVASTAWLEGCSMSGRVRGSAPAAPAGAPAAVATPALAHDFTPLVMAPFGTAFKDVPGPLTEVLVFHQSDTGRSSEDADCFRPSVVVSFLGRAPADHLLCFDHDRLKRIEASVALPAAEAPALFAAACADWGRGNAATALEPDACAGREGAIAFSAHRAQDADSAAATVSITLVAAESTP
jgi:hypothetical protein